MKRLNTFAKLAIASSFAFGAIAPVATMVAPIHAQEGEAVGMYDTHNIENLKIELVGDQLVANGESQIQKVKVTCPEENLVLEEGVDYKLEDNVVKESGYYTLTIKGINDYHGERRMDFTVAEGETPVGPIDGMYDTHNIENLNVRLANQLVANGDTQAQKVVISCSEENLVLEEGVDYEIENNRVQDAGDYTLTVKGINNYHGVVKVNFTVAQQETPVGPIDGMYDTHNIENLKVCLANQLTANGSSQAQKVKIVCEKENLVLEEGVDYQLENNVVTEAGDYTLTVRGIDNYHGVVKVNFTVAQQETPVGPINGMWDTHNIENLNVRLANQLVSNGSDQVQKIVITCEKENLVLEQGIDYVLSNNIVKDAGNYTLTARGINDYHGEIKVNFTVQQGTNKKSVHTGTETNAFVYAGLGATAAAALGAIAVMMSRKNRA